ncbi:MAG: DEAD/DEAH box helicase [bacterium]
MQVAHLTSFGIPETLVETWRQRLGSTLLPVQSRAVREFDLLSGQSLLICSPTSSGKTFCGELAAAAAICNRRKAIFLVPLKSIAEEKFVEFRNRYESLGVRVVISSGDHHEYDRRIARGEFDLALIIYEKFNQLLIRNIDLLGIVNLLLVDEVQMLGEGKRGAALELALLKVLAAEPRPQLVALSGVLHEPELLADWLGCRLLADEFRPVELRQGVLYGGRFDYREHNSGTLSSEILSELEFEDPEELLLASVKLLVNRGEQVLVFVKSKRDCAGLAWRLAECSFQHGAEETIERLLAEVSSQLSEQLVATLQAGVAFHHAGLSFRQRHILEAGFRSGEVKVLVSTTTLAMGVNLPAQTVFIDCFKYECGRNSGKPLLAPLRWGEYEGMSGRAGRICGNPEFGRAVLIAASEFERELLWQSYVLGKPDSLKSSLAGRALVDVLLDLIASGEICEESALAQLLDRSFQARFETFKPESISTALQKLIDVRLVLSADGRLQASALGSLLAEQGVTTGSGLMLIDELQEYTGIDRFSWFYMIAGLPDVDNLPHLSYRDQQEPGRYREALRHYLAEHADASPALKKLLEESQVLGERELKRLRAALVLLDWISEKCTAEIEATHLLSLGQLLQLAENVGWLLECAATMAALLNQPTYLVEELHELADAVRQGFDLPDTIIPYLGLAAEQRDAAWALAHFGLKSRNDFNEQNRERLNLILGESMTAELISRFAKQNDSAEEVAEMPKLKVTGRERGSRVLLQFDSTEIDVSPKSFNYLFKLAAARLMSQEGWLSKEEIEPGFNQAKNIYRVKQELKSFETGLERFIENNKSGHYRINLLPDQILIDFDTMSACTDLELAALAQRVQERQPVAN